MSRPDHLVFRGMMMGILLAAAMALLPFATVLFDTERTMALRAFGTVPAATMALTFASAALAIGLQALHGTASGLAGRLVASGARRRIDRATLRSVAILSALLVPASAAVADEDATAEETHFASWLTGEWVETGAGSCEDPHLRYRVEGDLYRVWQVRPGYDLPLGANQILAVEGRNARVFHPSWPAEQIIQYVDEETHLLSQVNGIRGVRFTRCR
ncbi:MAG: hypothetical protein AAF713_18780 [Pseudomonadota bacterium]